MTALFENHVGLTEAQARKILVRSALATLVEQANDTDTQLPSDLVVRLVKLTSDEDIQISNEICVGGLNLIKFIDDALVFAGH